MPFIQKVRASLDSRHLKPADLARLTGFSKSRISKWFSGEGTPSVYQAFEIAKALRVPLSWLADDEQPDDVPADREDEDREILFLARSLGRDEAIRRLLLAEDVRDGSPPKVLRPEVGRPGEGRPGEGPAGGRKKGAV